MWLQIQSISLINNFDQSSLNTLLLFTEQINKIFCLKWFHQLLFNVLYVVARDDPDQRKKLPVTLAELL